METLIDVKILFLTISITIFYKYILSEDNIILELKSTD